MTENEDIILWRYVDFPKFVDLIQTSSLFFAKAEALRDIDWHEGREFGNKEKDLYIRIINDKNDEIPISEISSIHNIPNFMNTNLALREYTGTKESIFDYLPDNEKRSIAKGIAKERLEWEYGYKDRLLFNCWHKNIDESYALWKIYANDYGIAIKSDYYLLKSSLKLSKIDRLAFFEIEYVDYNDPKIRRKNENCFDNFRYKRREFAYEQELRLGLFQEEGSKIFTHISGIKIEVDLYKLIDKIYISPFAPKWFYEVVKSFCISHGIKEEIIKQSAI